MGTATLPKRSAALQRCLNSPYLSIEENKAAGVQQELDAARRFYRQCVSSFRENDEAAGLKQAWAVMFRAARALVYKAGYQVEQLRCLEIVLLEHYPGQISQDDINQLRHAQELAGPPNVAMERAKQFLQKVTELA